MTEPPNVSPWRHQKEGVASQSASLIIPKEGGGKACIPEYHVTLIVDLSADVAPESLLEAPPIRGRIGVAAVLTLSFTYISQKGNMDIETQEKKNPIHFRNRKYHRCRI